MAAGIVTYDEQGRETFNATTSATTYVIGYHDTGRVAGSLTINKLNGQKVWLALVARNTTGEDTDAQIYNMVTPSFFVTDNGTTAVISWDFRLLCSYDRPLYASVRFVYGVFVR